MSNEVAWDYTSGAALYFCRFQPNGDVFISDGSSDEVWGAGGNDADDYDVGLVESGASGHFVGHFDTPGNIANGDYRVTVYVQAGANPADADVAVAQGIMFWRGESINAGDIYDDLVVVDGIADNILTDTNEIQNKLPDDYIMGSSVTTPMDDEINNILTAQTQVQNEYNETGDASTVGTSGARGVSPQVGN